MLHFSRVVAVLAVASGLLVLSGWALDVAALKSVAPGLATMKANTALAFSLSGLSLWFTHSASLQPRKRLAQVCAGVVLLLGLLTLAEYLFGWQSGLDQWLVRDRGSGTSQVFPGRMAPATAASFTLLGAALLALDIKRPRAFWPAQWLALAVGFNGLVATLGYSYGVKSLYGVQPFSSVAIHTTLLFVLIAAGVLCARPAYGVMQRFTGQDPGGILLRRLLPAALLVPTVVGWLRLQGELAGFYDSRFGLALFATCNILIFSVLIWLTASAVQRIDVERQRAEHAALASQRLLRDIVESSDDAIISMTPDGILTSWNSGAERLFGYSRQDAVGKPLRILFPAENVTEERSELLARIRRGEIIRHFETVRVRKDGERIDLSASISPIHNNEGQIIGVSTIARDITERKRSERRLHSQMMRLELLNHITRAIGERQDEHSIFQALVRNLEDQLPVDFCCVGLHDMADHTLTIDSVGIKGAELALQLQMSEQARVAIDENGLSRCVAGELVYEPDIAQVQLPFPQRLARCGLRAVVVAPLRVESKVFGALLVARRGPNAFSSGECEFLQQVSQHVAVAAHQAQLYGSLQQAYDDLRQTQQAVMQQERLRSLGQMASAVAHDINNAISPATLYIESLLEQEPDLSTAARDKLTIVLRAMGDVAHTVGRLREFYHHREAEVTLVPVDVNSVVEQAAELTRARWSDIPQQRGVVIELRRELAAHLPAVLGAESELREALTNLIFNAIDAMPVGGTLTLRTRTEASHVQIEVGDTGIGMNEDTRRRCLEPFFTTKGERGTGLGLAMVYGIVRRHGAEIEIESSEGRGTLFRLVLTVPEKGVSTEPARVDSQPEIPSGLRLLVIDDDPLLIASLRQVLEGDGNAVVTANSGQAGIDVFLKAQTAGEPFNVVITDLGMPHVDGRKVATAIKAASPATPVILLSGWGQRLLAEGNIPAHVDCVLPKPPRLPELRAALMRCSQKKRRTDDSSGRTTR